MMEWQDIKRELRDTATKREYDALAMEHELARAIVMRRLEAREARSRRPDESAP